MSIAIILTLSLPSRIGTYYAGSEKERKNSLSRFRNSLSRFRNSLSRFRNSLSIFRNSVDKIFICQRGSEYNFSPTIINIFSWERRKEKKIITLIEE
tara:strand:+ start:671 stop:961 length:291 start_codon:yes stop_codon:yes gene_type:complete